MRSPRSFSHIDTWVFDLDNTLYPHHVNLWQQVDARIGEFISAYLKIPSEEAWLATRVAANKIFLCKWADGSLEIPTWSRSSRPIPAAVRQ